MCLMVLHVWVSLTDCLSVCVDVDCLCSHFVSFDTSVVCVHVHLSMQAVCQQDAYPPHWGRRRHRRFWHATQDCIAPYVDIILHRGGSEPNLLLRGA